MSELSNKLNEFFSSISDISNALNTKNGGGSTYHNLADIANAIGEIETERDMGSQTVMFEQHAIILGVKVEQAEQDPDKRVQPTDDLVGHVRVTVDQSSGTVDYGTIQDTFLFKALNHIVLKSIDKSEEIELNPNDYSKKLKGGNAPTADHYSDYNTFARADLVYIYQYDQDGYEYFKVADKKIDKNFEPIGFYSSNENILNSIYMATYLGSLDGQNRLRSISGVRIRVQDTFTTFYNEVQKLGSSYHMETHAHINLYELAYLMMFQNDNSAVLGGRSLTQSETSNTARQETGYLNNKGPIAYDTSSKGIKFMHIEDFIFSGGNTWEEGICNQNNKTYIKMKPPYPLSDLNGNKSSYVEVVGAAESNGSISASVVSNKWGRIPSKVLSAATTRYQCNMWYPYNSYNYLAASFRGSGIWGRNIFPFDGGAVSVAARLSLIPSN